MSALTEVDAAMYWRSLISANDQFLVYAFDAAPGPGGPADPVAELRARAAHIPDLRLGIGRAPGDLNYPRWVAAGISDDQFRAHDARTWDDCLRSVAGFMKGGLMTGGLMTGGPITGGLSSGGPLWRIHVFGSVSGVPTATGPATGLATVVVLQISHALADGRRASSLARRLLSAAPGPKLPSNRAPSGRGFPSLASAVAAGAGAATALPRLLAATAVGTSAWRDGDSGSAGPEPIEATALNLPGDLDRELRTITLARAGLRALAPSVTVAVLVALADVLPDFGGAAVDGRTVAEVTVARDPMPGRHNNFHTVGIDLRADAPSPVRAAAIADQLAAARLRDAEPARRRARRAASLAPAVLSSLGVRLAARAPLPTHVTGATVVSSVNRGPADLTLGGGRVLCTAGFPALSAVHGLTHGVHGIGDAITVSLAASGHAATIVDDYAAALAARLG